jgi:ATP-dependent helicase HrpA
MNVRVLDAAGAVIAHGRDLGKIKQALGIRDSVPEGMIRDPRYERDGIRRWDFGELPERVEVRRGPFDVPAYPALVDRHDHVSLCLMDNPCAAARALRAGLRRLVVLAESHELKSQVQWLPHLNEIQLWASTLGHQRDVKQQITDLLAQRAFVEPSPRPHTAEDFAALRQEGNEHVLVVVQEVTSLLPPLFETYHEAQCALDDATSALEREAAADVREQLAMLVPEGFLAETPWQWLLHFPRYFRGMRLRLERLRAGSHARDSQATRQLAPLWRQYIDRFRRNLQRSIDDPDLDEYRWMLEEYRVSLFAQTLGTSMKVSPQRLARQWAKVR